MTSYCVTGVCEIMRSAAACVIGPRSSGGAVQVRNVLSFTGSLMSGLQRPRLGHFIPEENI